MENAQVFNYVGKEKGLLFFTHDLQQSLNTTIQSLRDEIEALNADRFLNTAPADLAQYLVDKYRVEQIVLQKDQWYAAESEIQIDVRHHADRYISDRSHPVLMPGQRMDIRVPFSGERELLYARANQYNMNPPRAVVDGQELLLRYEFTSDAARDIRAEVDTALRDIEEHLSWQAPQIAAHNGSLPHVADGAIESRRQRLLANSQRLASLGIPVKPRADAPLTYAIPTVRRKAAATLPPATSTPFEPEPVWAMDQYEQALHIIQQMTLVMERSPSAFKTMGEEALRQNFLVQLNAQFEGKATGETFNLQGKTDILLREGSRNVFIAECKMWKGQKKFGDAIDQLLGYTAWRDSKTAILVFNRGTELTKVLAGVAQVAEAHGNYKRTLNWPHETGFRYVFHHNGDPNREFILTVLVFEIPA